MFYYHSPNCKERKKRFDKEEEYEENGFILIHLVGKKMGLKENKEKKWFEREEEDWEDGFIPIHSVANKGK